MEGYTGKACALCTIYNIYIKGSMLSKNEITCRFRKFSTTS